MKFGVKFHSSTEQAFHNFSHASGAGILVPSWLTLALSEPANHHRLILGSSVGANVLRHCRAIWCARHHVRGNVKHALAIAIVKNALFLSNLLLNRLSLYCFVLSLVLCLRTTASEVGAAEDLSWSWPCCRSILRHVPVFYFISISSL